MLIQYFRSTGGKSISLPIAYSDSSYCVMANIIVEETVGPAQNGHVNPMACTSTNVIFISASTSVRRIFCIGY